MYMCTYIYCKYCTYYYVYNVHDNLRWKERKKERKKADTCTFVYIESLM